MNRVDATQSFRLVLSFCWRQWRRQPWQVCGVVLSMLLGTLCDTIVPVFAGRLIDALSHPDDGKVIALHAVLLIAALAACFQLFRLSAFSLLTLLSTRVMKEIVGSAFARVQRYSTDWHASSFTGATVRKITRGMWAYDQLADTLLLGFFPAFVVLVAVTAMLAARWAVMGLVVAAGVIGFVTLSVTLVVRYLAPISRMSTEVDSRIGAVIADAIDCNAVVKSFAREIYEEIRLGEVTELWRRRTTRTWLLHSLAGTGQGVVMVALQAAVLSLGIYLWIKGRATPGDVAYVLTTYTLVHGYLREISNHIRNLQRAVTDMEDVANFMQMDLGIEDRPGAVPLPWRDGHLRFNHVTFRYRGQSKAIYEDFSLDLRAGECVGLVGHSGSGKSTFVKLIQRLYDVDAGQILIDGQDIAQVTQESLRTGIALVPQEPVLFHRSLAENIGYGRPKATRAEIIEAAKRARADEFIHVLPLGYDTLVGERGVKLSGGERQRVALARAVLADSKVLILDEATSSLDSISESLMQQAIKAVIAGRTTIIIAHRLSTIQSVDRILVFDDGRIVEQGTHAELLRRENGHYRALFECQALGLVGSPL